MGLLVRGKFAVVWNAKGRDLLFMRDAPNVENDEGPISQFDTVAEAERVAWSCPISVQWTFSIMEIE